MANDHVDASQIPDEFKMLFARPPILATESVGDYMLLLENTAAMIGPEDAVEWMLVKTMVDQSWELLSLGRARAAMIDGARKEALIMILRSIIEESTIRISREQDALELAEDWFNDNETKCAIVEHLNDYNLDEESITAEAIRIRVRELEQLERMMANKEARRDYARREIDLYREGRHLRNMNKFSSSKLPRIAGSHESGSSLAASSGPERRE